MMATFDIVSPKSFFSSIGDWPVFSIGENPIELDKK